MGQAPWGNVMNIEPVTLVGVGLTIVQAIIAGLTFRSTRQNNIGSKPLLLFTRVTRYDQDEDMNGDTLEIELEIWNRRTYPIVIRRMEVYASDADFEPLIRDSVFYDDVSKDGSALKDDNAIDWHPTSCGGFQGFLTPIRIERTSHRTITCTFTKGKP